jgi:hypothetical protein
MAVAPLGRLLEPFGLLGQIALREAQENGDPQAIAKAKLDLEVTNSTCAASSLVAAAVLNGGETGHAGVDTLLSSMEAEAKKLDPKDPMPRRSSPSSSRFATRRLTARR